jgi:hypothetical protein
MTFNPLKKIVLASGLMLSCAFNAAAQAPTQTTRPIAEGHVHFDAAAQPGDTVYRNVDKNGVLVSIERYTDGNLNDGQNGEPAYQEFNGSGNVIAVERYQNGALNDNGMGEPAVQNFNDDGGLTHEEHDKNGDLNDGARGEPAFQDFDDNGKLVLAMRYRKGVLTAILSEAERANYQRGHKPTQTKTTAPTPTPAPEKPARPHRCLLKRIFHRH